MALILFIRKWWSSVVNNFRCGLYGHTNVTVLERYDLKRRMKFSGEVDGKKFKKVRCDLLETYQAKCACRGCSEVFLTEFQTPRQ